MPPAIFTANIGTGYVTSIEDSFSLGKKLFVSDIPVHREQCQERAIYFDPMNVSNLVECIKESWSNLPNGFSLQDEQNALIEYQVLGEEFARSLIKLLKFSSHQMEPASFLPFQLPIFLHRRIIAREKDCQMRLEVINRYIKKLSIKWCKTIIRKLSVFKRIFY